LLKNIFCSTINNKILQVFKHGNIKIRAMLGTNANVLFIEYEICMDFVFQQSLIIAFKTGHFMMYTRESQFRNNDIVNVLYRKCIS